jgi:hypothetical protein
MKDEITSVHVFPLEHAKKIYYSGFLLLFLLFPLISILILYTTFPFNAAVFLFIYLMITMFIIFSGSAYVNLGKIQESLGEKYKILEFHAFTLQMKVKDDEEKEYVIAYHSLCAPYSLWVYIHFFIFFTWDTPPEHYHIWIDIKDTNVKPYKNRYNFLDYMRPSGLKRFYSMTGTAPQGEFIFDDEITRVAPRFHPRAKEIPSLRIIGLVKEHRSPIILALLAQNANFSDILKTLELLRDMSNEF